jgi:hypothetical protein
MKLMRKMKKIVWFYVRFVQKVLITILLTIVYFLVLGPTLLLIIIFKRRLLFKNYDKMNTFWVEAKDYTSDFQNNLSAS